MRSAIFAYVVLVMALLLVPCLHGESCVGKALSPEKAANIRGGTCYSLDTGSDYFCYEGTHDLDGYDSGKIFAYYIKEDPNGYTITTVPCPCGGTGGSYIGLLTDTPCYPD